jgi:uncharacterized RDD family membrane protein YckC
VAGATGLDAAAEAVAEEAIVRALESAAVERALQRLLEGPLLEEAVAKALASPAVERSWQRLLDSDEVQQLIERIAQAPEVRAAIASQGIGLVEDLGRQLGGVTRDLDDVIERVVRRATRRAQRAERTDRAGLVTRAAALLLDFGVVNLAFVAASALIAFILGRSGDDTGRIVIGAGVWLLVGGAYLTTFWSLAGQTPGMRLVGVQLDAGGTRRIGARRAFRRLIGLALALLPIGLGLIGVVSSDRRRGFHDRVAGTEVIYARAEAGRRSTSNA